MGKYIDLLMERYLKLVPVKQEIEETVNVLTDCFKSGGKLLVGGNGGSMADSEHIVGELMKGFVKKRELPDNLKNELIKADKELGEKLAESLQGSLRAMTVTGEQGLSTAFANDVDPNMCFAQQVNGYGRKGDVFLAISTSGNALNLMYAAVTAKARDMKVILLSGKSGGRLATIADVKIIVPEQETYKIQELHLPIYHAVCLELEDIFF